MIKRRKPVKPKAKHRASWRGQLRFGLVSFEVQAVNARIKEQSDIHFHLLHEPDHQRIHYAKVCPKHGEVPNDEIVEGYEYAKGKYVEFDKQELDTLKTEQQRVLSIDAFVNAAEIDPLYFDGRMYYLIPAGAPASEPYALLQAAMERKKMWGIGQVVFSGREQLAVVRPLDGVLAMAMLNYDAEIRKPAEIRSDFSRPRIAPAKLKLAEMLITRWQEEKLDFASYKDRYRQKVKEAVAAKSKGGTIEPPEEMAPEVINLMDALKRSLQEATPKRGPTKTRTGAARKRTRKAAAPRKRA